MTVSLCASAGSSKEAESLSAEIFVDVLADNIRPHSPQVQHLITTLSEKLPTALDGSAPVKAAPVNGRASPSRMRHRYGSDHHTSSMIERLD